MLLEPHASQPLLVLVLVQYKYGYHAVHCKLASNLLSCVHRPASFQASYLLAPQGCRQTPIAPHPVDLPLVQAGSQLDMGEVQPVLRSPCDLQPVTSCMP